jgi:hypothetical protein
MLWETLLEPRSPTSIWPAGGDAEVTFVNSFPLPLVGLCVLVALLVALTFVYARLPRLLD